MKITLNEQEITEALELYVRQKCISGCNAWDVSFINLDTEGVALTAVVSVKQDDSPRPYPSAPAAVPPRTF